MTQSIVIQGREKITNDCRCIAISSPDVLLVQDAVAKTVLFVFPEKDQGSSSCSSLFMPAAAPHAPFQHQPV
jgi:hypothetical protein